MAVHLTDSESVKHAALIDFQITDNELWIVSPMPNKTMTKAN